MYKYFKPVPNGYIGGDEVLALLHRKSRQSLYDLMAKYPDFPRGEHQPKAPGRKLLWSEQAVRDWIAANKDKLIEDAAKCGLEVSYD